MSATIDDDPDRPILLTEARDRFFPLGRDGRPIHISTIIDYIKHGRKRRRGGVCRLEATRLPGQWYVTPRAIREFMDALAADLIDSEEPAPDSRPLTVRTQAAEQAMKNLARKFGPSKRPVN